MNAGWFAVSVAEVQALGTPFVSANGLSLSMHFSARSRKMSSVAAFVVVPGR